MKKIVFCFVALVAFIACSEQKPFNYRGLSFTLPASQLVDSLLARGFLVDSATSDSGSQYQLYKAGEPYRVLVAYENDQIRAIQDMRLDEYILWNASVIYPEGNYGGNDDPEDV